MITASLPNRHKPPFAISANVEAMANRLREIRKSRGLTLEKLGEKTGMSHVQVSRLEKGERQLKSYQLEAFAQALEVPAEDILGDRPRVDVIGFVGSGAHITHFAEEPGALGIGSVECPRGLNPATTVALRVAVPLDPLIGRNWLLFYSEDPVFEADRAVGKLCAVELESGERMLAQVRQHHVSGGFQLIPYGAPIVEDAHVKTAWPIAAFLSAEAAGVHERPLSGARRRRGEKVEAAAGDMPRPRH
jgi:transcriptional regulator with XRE-family HTH domain